MSLSAFLGALGLLIAAEGLAYAAFPGRVREALSALLALDDAGLRRLGFAAAAAGLVLLAAAAASA